MTKRQKRLQRIRQNPENVRFDDLMAVLRDYGFIVRQGKGSHVTVAQKIDDIELTFTIVCPHGGKRHMKRPYVKQALQAIDEVINLLESETINDDD